MPRRLRSFWPTGPAEAAASAAVAVAVVEFGGVSHRILVAPGDPDRPHDELTVRAKASALLGVPSDDGRITAVLELARAPRARTVLGALIGANTTS